MSTSTKRKQIKELNESNIVLLMKDFMEQYSAISINTKGVNQAICDICLEGEYERLVFTISQMPSCNRTEEQESIVKAYRKEIINKLAITHLFIVRGKELQIIRRPRILLSYIYAGRIFLAISERSLVTGQSGVMVVADIGDFAFLPKPAKLSVGSISKAWGLSVADMDKFIESKYLKTPHIEQDNIFYDDQIIVLLYTTTGEFLGALPAAKSPKTIYLDKGRVRKK